VSSCRVALFRLAAVPWLVLLARSRAYGPFRVGGAAVTGLAAAWLAERALGWVNPIAPLVDAVASHAIWLLVGLVALTVVASSHESSPSRPSPSEEPIRCGCS
jgi:hypothetical protein